MKHIILLTLILVCQSTLSFGQVDVLLNIHHKLGDVPFELNVPAENNLNHQFIVDRMQYYISGLSITHDGGQVTLVEDVYILVDASEESSTVLGQYMITQVEGITLHIGVDEASNHNDPASYPSEHPLAPKFPSMHWGWAAGYRFAAFEGYGGVNLDQRIELHGLLDRNYFRTFVEVEGVLENDQLSVNLDADMAAVLHDIPVDQGNILHGGVGVAEKSLENMRDFVFTASELVSAAAEVDQNHAILNVYPVPTIDGEVRVDILEKLDGDFDVVVRDITGRMIQKMNVPAHTNSVSIQLPEAGVYFVEFYFEDFDYEIRKKVSRL